MRWEWKCSCGRAGLERTWSEAQAKGKYHAQKDGHRLLSVERAYNQ